MKKFGISMGAVLGAALLVVTAGGVAADVVVKRTQLDWQDIAHNDGGELYANLCSACHGPGGKGNGYAAGQLDGGVPDLTVLTINNGGVYPQNRVANTIYGKYRTPAHNALDMPAWGEQFMYVGHGWHSFPRRKLAQERIATLTQYVGSLQVD